MNKTLIIVFTMILSLFPVITNSASDKEIVVSAAISLKDAFEEIGRAYETKSGVKAVFNFGASGLLASQIEGGAPVDVFASAAQEDMDLVDKKGVILHDTRVNFASNSIVLVIPIGTALTGLSFKDLKGLGIGRIAVGNPKTVPAGRYAADVLDYYRLTGVVREKLVFTENVRQALDYVARMEVDAGIVYATDARVRSRDVRQTEIAPDESHRPILYPIAVVRQTQNTSAAKAFISLLLSPDGCRILEKYGFKTVK